jgi:hypothetical protein
MDLTEAMHFMGGTGFKVAMDFMEAMDFVQAAGGGALLHGHITGAVTLTMATPIMVLHTMRVTPIMIVQPTLFNGVQ